MNLSQRPGLILFIGILLAAFVWLIDVVQDERVTVIGAVPSVIRHPASESSSRALAPVLATENKTGHATLPPLRVRVQGLSDTTPEAHAQLIATARAVAVHINGKEQSVLNARAVVESQYRPEMGAILRKQNGFILIAAPKPNDETAIVIHDADRPVLLNPANGSIGIVSGTLIIKLKNLPDAQAFGARHGLSLLTVNSEISRAYFRVPENFNLSTDNAKILADPDVEDLEIEILRGKVGFK